MAEMTAPKVWQKPGPKPRPRTRWNVRVEKDLHDLVEAEAKRLDMGVHDFVRHAVMKALSGPNH